MKWLSFTSLALISLGSFQTSRTTAGCGETTSPAFSALPQVGLSQKQVVKLDVDDFVADPDNADADLTIDVSGGDTARVAASIDPATHILTLTAAAGWSGRITLQLTVSDPDGNTSSGTLDVQVHANRSCSTTFTYDANAHGAASSVNLAGQFNGWSSTTTKLNGSNGVYTVSMNLAPGVYQYKFVLNTSNWILDPATPYRGFENGIENSEVTVPDCKQPLLELVSIEADGVNGDVSAVVRYVDGADGLGPDPAKLLVTAGEDEVDGVWSDFDRTLELTLTGLPRGKHSLRFNAANQNGLAASQLYVPVWSESSPFSWDDASLYFAFTDRFANGTTANDRTVGNVATLANYQGGDYAGLTAKIQEGYFDALGINALWLSPQLDNTENAEYGDDGRLYSGYHGYWTTQGQSLESRFGNVAELKALIAAAHDRGIRVMFDLVSNHVHNQHPYYQQHMSDGWFNGYSLCKDNDGWNQNPVGCWFAPYLPDINYQNTSARHTLAADAVAIAKAFDIDGYRVDAVKHMEKAFLFHLVTDIERQIEHGSSDPRSQFYLVGETFTGEWNYGCDNSANCSQWLIKSYIGPHMLDGQFDFPMYWQVLKTFARYESKMSDLATLMGQSESYYGDDALMSPFLGNHDVARFISHANGQIGDQWGNGAKEQGWTNPPQAPSSYLPYQKLQLAFAFLATNGGVPLVYYGDDIGLPGAGDPDNRRMMRFGSSLSASESQTLAFVQKLFTLRATHPSLRTGLRQILLGNDADVLVYGRVGVGEKALVALNRSGSSRTVTVNVASMGLTAGTTLTDAIGGGSVSVSGGSVSLTIPAYSAAIYF